MYGEKLVTMEGDVLRAIFRSELRSGGCYGEDCEKKRAKAIAECIGTIFDVAELLDSLAEFLGQYSDLAIEKRTRGLHILGEQANRRKKPQKMHSCLKFDYNNQHNLLMVSVDGGSPFYCNLLELIDNLADRFGMQLALCIQEDQELKRFYQAYLNWLSPYQQQAELLRFNFQTWLVGKICALTKRFPKQKAACMPVTANIPYLTERFQEMLLQYHLAQFELPQIRQDIGFHVQTQQFVFSFLVDRITYNAVVIQYWDKTDEKTCCRRILTGSQTLTLLKQLQAESAEQDNPLARLLSKELDLLLYHMFILENRSGLSMVDL